jgi:hypothetical protein
VQAEFLDPFLNGHVPIPRAKAGKAASSQAAAVTRVPVEPASAPVDPRVAALERFLDAVVARRYLA